MREFRRFGFQLGLALNIVGFIMFYRGRGHFIWFTSVGSLNLIFALVHPIALAPLKKILDFIVRSIGRMVNFISLIIVFYLIFMPVALLLRLLRKDILHQKINKEACSYWIKRKELPFSKEYYERMG
jgi:hypothetical protein